MEENESPNDLKKTASLEDSAYNSSTNDEGKPQIKVDSAILTEATNDHKMQEMKQLEREPQKVSIIEENKEKDSEGQEDNEQTDKSQYPNQENQESHQPDDSEESDREDSSLHQVEEASEEDLEDIEVKANHDHGSVSNLDSDDYDPENTYEESPEPANITKNNEVEGNESNESSSSNESNESSKSNESAESDDYDPEVSLANPEDTKSTNAPTRLPPAGLPPKPPVNANKNTSKNSEAQGVLQNQQQLKKAYDALMHSEAIKNPDFVKLPQPEQMRLVLEELKKNNVSLSLTINPNINYDQVYSYNKPFKNLKNPIPLIPINEYSKRPNITLPMSHIEEEAYEEFINTEAHYMKLQVWDEFPDNLRLFIGNLPANTVSKQDLFRIFSQYGEVVQISIKAGYGFVQFRTSEACLEAIKGESGVPLHNKIMRLDASRPQKSKKQPKLEIVDTNFVSRGRERPSVESIRSTSEPESKKPKTVADCKILTTGSSSIFFIRQVKKVFSSHNISYTTEDVTHTNTSDAISDAAYSGVLATCIIKEMRVDLQTFESTSDGGIKFDEYSDIDPASAAEVVEKAQRKRYGNNKRQKQVPSLAISYQDDPLPQGGSNNVDQYGRRRNDRRGNSIGDRRNGGSSNSRIKQQYQNWDFLNQQSPHPFP